MDVESVSEIYEKVQIVSEATLKLNQELLDDPLEIPDWEKGLSKKQIINCYREVVIRNQKVNDMSSVILGTILSLKKMRRKVGGSSSARESRYMIDSVDAMIEDMNASSSILLNHKSSIEAFLRYYNSIQYLLASPRLTGMD